MDQHPGPRSSAHDSRGGRHRAVSFGRIALERTGIEVQPVEQRPMVSELVVNGVVAYDESADRAAFNAGAGQHLAVERHLGDHVRRGDVLLVIDSQDVGQLKAEFLTALVVHESRREQLAILEEVKGAVMGRQIREAAGPRFAKPATISSMPSNRS